ncbi:MAG TPA: NAD(P)/FAD-dependent oxidoreductase [Candidatus Eisenbacteria bacterium]|nr:NAD(P)/FAD-dependent oxidoreductase [Candidatus Eisenbacteria bacterium]
MSRESVPRVVILGGGFGGLYTALEFERRLAKGLRADVVLVNQENFFLFTPMLHEVAASDLDITDIVSPIRKLVRRVRFFQARVEAIDLEGRVVEVSHGAEHHHHRLEYDHLVLALGSVTNFHGLEGLEENAVTMKSLGDAIHLRNRLIANLEEADLECCAHAREGLMTVVVAGGGFAGVETLAGVNDFVREALEAYPNLEEAQLRMILVHSGEEILPELGAELGSYARRKLVERGVTVLLGRRVAAATADGVTLNDGTFLATRTLVWAAGTAPHPAIAALPCARERGRVRVGPTLEAEGRPGVWALGDCAHVMDPAVPGGYPPTAQHALRQGKVVARNVIARWRGREARPFSFRALGQLAAIGRRTGVARILGLQFSGFAAWFLWRTIYLGKLPRLEKKLRVMLGWTLDLFFSKDLVQFLTLRSSGVSHEEAASRGKSEPPGQPLAAIASRSAAIMAPRSPSGPQPRATAIASTSASVALAAATSDSSSSSAPREQRISQSST